MRLCFCWRYGCGQESHEVSAAESDEVGAEAENGEGAGLSQRPAFEEIEEGNIVGMLAKCLSNVHVCVIHARRCLVDRTALPYCHLLWFGFDVLVCRRVLP